MDLAHYFESHDGTGILATSNADGQVDMAVYTKPHVIDAETLALVMKQRLSHQNLKSNLHAAYLFMEHGPGYKGLRLQMTLLREETNQTLAESLRKKQPMMYPEADDSNKYVVFFHIDRIRPLVGDFSPPESEE